MPLEVICFRSSCLQVLWSNPAAGHQKHWEPGSACLLLPRAPEECWVRSDGCQLQWETPWWPGLLALGTVPLPAGPFASWWLLGKMKRDCQGVPGCPGPDLTYVTDKSDESKGFKVKILNKNPNCMTHTAYVFQISDQCLSGSLIMLWS